MLPHDYQLPAGIILVLAGVLACFAGYRLLRIVLAVYGFVLGAMIAGSLVGMKSTVGVLVVAVAGGLVGSLILVFAYFVGIALIGAALGALVAYAAAATWPAAAAAAGPGAPTDPSTLLLVAASIVGAVSAMVLQRYVIVVSTAFAGAWTLIIGAVAATGNRTSPGSPVVDVWMLYPFSQALGQRGVVIGWLALGALGMVVQLWMTRRKR